MSQLTDEYKKLVQHILADGLEQACRNGKQLIVPHYSFILDHSWSDNHTLKLRKMFYKGVQGEFDTLINPFEKLTNVAQFRLNGCNYWEKWAGEHGSLNLDYYNELHPALERVIEQIKRDPDSRRHVVSLWNNDNAFDGSLSLHCCWHNLTFSIINGYIHLTWAQRSVDTMIGLPADIYLSWLFMLYVANKTDLKIGSCMYSLSNVHIYEEHIENASELLGRTEEDFSKPLNFGVKA